MLCAAEEVECESKARVFVQAQRFQGFDERVKLVEEDPGEVEFGAVSFDRSDSAEVGVGQDSRRA